MEAQKEVLLDRWEDEGWSLTYADFRTEPFRSSVAARDVDISSRFSTTIELKLPFVSSPMDTVTDSNMAIAMAKLGGLGVIHSALDETKQRDEVRRVKRSLNGRIETPITVTEDMTVGQVLKMCDDKRYPFRTFPVIDSCQKFVGLLGSKDFDFCESAETLVREVMTASDEVVTGEPGVSIKQAYDIMRGSKKMQLPLLNKLGQVAGLYLFREVKASVHGDNRMHNLDSQQRLRVAAAFKTDGSAVERIDRMTQYLDVAVIDTAQGDSHYVFDTLKQIKAAFPHLDVVVGNISNPYSAIDLAKAGADGFRVGQGPGSICTTREKTGIGIGQVTAVYGIAKALEQNGFDIPICADGGIVNPGDVSVIIAAGAHNVMFGSRLAGTNEAPGEIIRNEKGEQVKFYRGMGSISAMEDAGTRDRYGFRADEKLLAEGVESLVPAIGSVDDVIAEFAGYLRKGLSYCGAANIAEHRHRTRLRRASPAVLAESKPHSVQVVTMRHEQSSS